MVSQARVKLNRILQDLYLQWDWPFLWTTGNVTVPPNAIFTLPADFLKAEDDQSLVITAVGGVTVFRPVQELDHVTFQRFQRSGALYESTAPRCWTTDYANMVGTAWPRPMETLPATFRYKRLPPDMPSFPPSTDASVNVAYDADIPTFPWDAYLSDALVQWGMEYEADPRANDQLGKNREQLAMIRGATFPERSYRSNVPLDPTVFSTPWRDWGWWGPGW